jgi:hypothetical protein
MSSAVQTLAFFLPAGITSKCCSLLNSPALRSRPCWAGLRLLDPACCAQQRLLPSGAALVPATAEASAQNAGDVVAVTAHAERVQPALLQPCERVCTVASCIQQAASLARVSSTPSRRVHAHHDEANCRRSNAGLSGLRCDSVPSSQRQRHRSVRVERGRQTREWGQGSTIFT